jgi:hypothetical protein
MTDFQHDYVLDDAPGASVRADINAALLAIAHKNQGASQPSATFSLLEWGDITANLLKRRNAANSGWIIYDTLAETFLVARSSNTVIGVSDFKKTFIFTSSFTQTFNAVSTLPDGWYCGMRNDGSGTITLDPNGSETIDNATTITLGPGESCLVYSNGSALKTIGRKTSSTFRTPAVRQTVIKGAVDSSGYPNFITAGSGLSVDIAAAATNLIMAAAGGHDSSGPVDYIGAVTADTSIGSLSDNNTNYLYADIDSSGGVTFGKTILAPVYQWGGTYSTTNNQCTFNIQEMMMKVGNGTSASQVYRVFIGEAVTSGGAVTSVVNYALHGRFISQQIATATSSEISIAHKIGCKPEQWQFVLHFNDSEYGFVAGDEVYICSHEASTQQQSTTGWANATKVGASFNTAFGIISKTGANNYISSFTDAKFIFKAWRGW